MKVETEIVSVPEAARILGVTLGTVRNLIRRGLLKAARIEGYRSNWSIRRADVERVKREMQP